MRFAPGGKYPTDSEFQAHSKGVSGLIHLATIGISEFESCWFCCIHAVTMFKNKKTIKLTQHEEPYNFIAAVFTISLGQNKSGTLNIFKLVVFYLSYTTNFVYINAIISTTKHQFGCIQSDIVAVSNNSGKMRNKCTGHGSLHKSTLP